MTKEDIIIEVQQLKSRWSLWACMAVRLACVNESRAWSIFPVSPIGCQQTVREKATFPGYDTPNSRTLETLAW